MAGQTEIYRTNVLVESVTISATLGTSTPVNIQKMAYGGFHVTTAAITAVAVAFYGSKTAGGTFQAIYDSAGAAVSIPGVDNDRSYEIPAAVFSFGYFKMLAASGDFLADVEVKG